MFARPCSRCSQAGSGASRNLRVADLFAGSGALGLEALSRGAASATFVESNPAALAALQRNVEKLGAGDRASVVNGSALALPGSPPFDLIFADPPYAPASGMTVINAIHAAHWLAPGGWLSVETARSEDIEAEGLILDATRDVGKARLTLLRSP